MLYTVYCQLFEDKEITLGYWDKLLKKLFLTKEILDIFLLYFLLGMYLSDVYSNGVR